MLSFSPVCVVRVMLLLRSFYPMALGTSRENNISAPSVRTRSSPSVTVMGLATWFMGRVFIVSCATWFHFWVHNMPIHLHALILKILGKFRTSTLYNVISWRSEEFNQNDFYLKIRFLRRLASNLADVSPMTSMRQKFENGVVWRSFSKLVQGGYVTDRHFAYVLPRF